MSKAHIFGVFLKFLEQQVLVQEIISGHTLKTHDTSEKMERNCALTPVIFRASNSPNLSLFFHEELNAVCLSFTAKRVS